MAGVTGFLSLILSARFTGAAIVGDTPQLAVNVEKRMAIEPGHDEIDEADVMYRATATIAASGNADVDLRGALADAFGATVNAAEVTALIVEAAAGNTNNVVFGPAASNGFTGPFGDASDRLSVQPGEFVVLTSRNGWPVTAGTGDLLNFANSGAGTGVDYTLTAIGRTVAA